MSLEGVIGAAVAALVGANGLLFMLLKRWIERKLSDAESRAERRKQEQQERFVVEDEYKHAVGRFLFWAAHGVEEFERDTGKSYWNGDLQTAYEAVKRAEEKKKELDRRQLANLNENT